MQALIYLTSQKVFRTGLTANARLKILLSAVRFWQYIARLFGQSPISRHPALIRYTNHHMHHCCATGAPLSSNLPPPSLLTLTLGGDSGSRSTVVNRRPRASGGNRRQNRQNQGPLGICWQYARTGNCNFPKYVTSR